MSLVKHRSLPLIALPVAIACLAFAGWKASLVDDSTPDISPSNITDAVDYSSSSDVSADGIERRAMLTDPGEISRALAALRARIDATSARAAELERKLVDKKPDASIFSTPSLTRLDDVSPLAKNIAPSAYQQEKARNKTPSGVSQRALNAFSSETGVSIEEVEGVMQR